ncbi:hypothetical protein IL54_0984 [Sphingobium sp. ba1]|nr:hypothetical protein IL54_0984 [Sphingobium sp. ba1]
MPPSSTLGSHERLRARTINLARLADDDLTNADAADN